MAGEIRRLRIAFIGGSFDRRRLPLLGVRTTVADTGRRRTSATGRSGLARPGDRARGRGGVRSVAVFRTRVAENRRCASLPASRRPTGGWERPAVAAAVSGRRGWAAQAASTVLATPTPPSPVCGPGSVQAPPERARLAHRRGDRGGR